MREALPMKAEELRRLYHEALAQMSGDDVDSLIRANAYFTSGLLLGGSWPGAAALVTLLMNKALPGEKFGESLRLYVGDPPNG